MRDPNEASDTRWTHGNRPRKRNKDNDLRVCSWNVRTLNATGAANSLEKVLSQYKADITAIQEVRWIGSGMMKRKTCDIYYSCNKEKHIFGCGFVVGKRLKDHVIDFKPITDRLAVIRIKAKFHNISLICVHAPTDEKDVVLKEEFYELLDKCYWACPNYDVKIVLGDFNAKIGKEDIFGKLVGKHSLHTTTTDNGYRLTDFAAACNTVISSTRFPHRVQHTATWLSPDGRTRNQIDHVLIDARHSSNILDVRSFRGANIDSDHMLVAARYRERLSNAWKKPTTPRKKFNVRRLSTPEIASRYREQLSTKLIQTPPPSPDNAAEHWQQCSDIIKAVASDTIGYVPRRTRDTSWYDEECEALRAAKDKAHKRMLQRNTRAARDEYRAKRREEKKVIRRKKNAFDRAQLSELEQSRNRGDVRKFYKKAKQLASGPSSGINALRDNVGNLVTDAQGIVETFRQHFQQLLNGERVERAPPQDLEHIPINPTDVPPPSIDGVRDAINRLQNNKAAGADELPAELFRAGGDVLVERMHQIISRVWLDERMPSDWSISSICPIFKKGDPMSCSNYRGISLLNVAYKILSKVLCEYLKPHCANLIGNYQCGFRPGKSTIDQIFALRQILEKTHEYRIDTHHLFIDFKAAYDSIDRAELFRAMAGFRIPEKLIRLCRMTLEDTRCTVAVGNSRSELFQTCTGFRQGDALSCDFFNLVLEQIVRKARVNTAGNICRQRSVQLLGFADDIDIIGRQKDNMIEVFTRLDEEARKVGLMVNEDKTKYMPSTSRGSSVRLGGTNLVIGSYNFEAVQEFVYLGVNVNSTNDISVEIRRRITLANRCYFGLSRQLGSKLLSRKNKSLLYKTLILPVLLYGAETWTLSSSSEQALGTFERKVLRRIYGPTREDGYWRRRFNHELYRLYKDVSVTTKVRQKRLQWLGHIERMDNSAPAKGIFETIPDGSRRRGRPSLRWGDQVQADLDRLRITNWKAAARDRRRWRNVVDQVKDFY